jgi:hypothetical protein
MERYPRHRSVPVGYSNDLPFAHLDFRFMNFQSHRSAWQLNPRVRDDRGELNRDNIVLQPRRVPSRFLPRGGSLTVQGLNSHKGPNGAARQSGPLEQMTKQDGQQDHHQRDPLAGEGDAQAASFNRPDLPEMRNAP